MTRPEEALEAKIRELAAVIQQTDLYREWQEARAALAEHHAAQVMLRDLQSLQSQLLRKAQAGETITADEEERLKRTFETVSYNPYVRAVLETDMAMFQLLAAVNQALAVQLGLEPDAAAPAAAAGSAGIPPSGEAPAAPPPEPPRRSRLWVPGQP